MRMNLNALAVRASSDEEARRELIESQERAILSIASKVTKKFVTKSDDEWSIALCAYSKAIDTYDFSKGSFSNYAAVVIKRSLIDYYRSEARHSDEVTASPSAFEGAGDECETALQSDIQFAVRRDSLRRGDASIREEISSLNEALHAFGFGFFALTDSSPKQEKTRRECAKAVNCLIHTEKMLVYVETRGQIPVNTLSEASGVPKKTLDRYRKYLLTCTLILCGDYPILSNYLKDLRKEAGK